MTSPIDKLPPAVRRIAKTVAALAVDQILDDPKSGLNKADHKTLRGRNRKLKREIKSEHSSETA
ncbi:hypothetical protein A3I99_00880 [Candidatus Kaiserbacteria bacterium RIFCSPLOWO2_02_FULL_45_11b]|uniref:Uncharacterized protein n=1 Tax=Candidatus Kaiserbacteria bacterium RIFCSPLOWO2_12_FULL_45_26 TaxID=1798525 RepID=A0A1F6FG25_9BACT|nr:MAG: hypothetical protein A2929_00195 [Candidatus Kaiserbacteria bacterium RIFCSPLOWO2_01_FULL_45_25]OGG84321.1 MAG: hypothetical protein A3I99_00880 [Candidatus Kaiserbacteria bacterium RIFCSPLOWO2_02_FULL_45_11b]OGG84823.1 MAG: hypothetical protein A3G90_01955 [Candidatus Kaiserbacteria bacterium RIFCSPLOWO2_12_FULL_45_26]